MSWLSQNYEKAAVGGAAVLALGLAALGWFKVGGVATDFPPPNPSTEGSGIEVAGADLVSKATSSVNRRLDWVDTKPDDHLVELFQGIPLFIHRDRPDTVIDLYTAKPVHEGIPNTWWLQYRIDPGFADSPMRDADEDGFSNREEFDAKTDPTKSESHPPLLDKLKYHRDESLEWSLRPSYPDGGKLSVKYYERPTGLNVQNKTPATGGSIPGDGMFFSSDPAKGRFKFLKFETKEEDNPRLNIKEKVTRAYIQDMKPNKKHLPPYDPPAPLSEARIWDLSHFDRKAVLTLEALGNGGKEAEIEEYTDFGLPLDNPKKEYHLKSVTPEQIVVEHIESKATTTIRKGEFRTREN
jgi:hypothetical protein